ncbi:hypothetical protein BCV72DRAFT_240683 [Rhizopus microsporus var. microsporus]|uniref:Uncharacterized protein n=2 Tax=Rhizopus microsporus TaxID=58291 RepID=A0A2G4SIQ2_RHIZD|nr:uncharacterized protein RHIMIDRAFT_247575 [Rhizopus microsporus ATCC 52813]ORE08200.1 hypothetical protein BCV72DRAFT_240683 [Rhizopus microsporus var. microsporus]PHZ08645.1 hypothetical protein RHIMIDRAFT_247575 [Rhizopus microsporus ATCC 52813]
MHRSTEQHIKRTNENDIKAEQNALVSAKARREFGVSDKNINTPKLTRSDSFGLKPKASNSIEKNKEEQSKSVKREFGLSDKNVNAPILTRSDSFGLRAKDSNLKGKVKTTEDKQSSALPTKRNKDPDEELTTIMAEARTQRRREKDIGDDDWAPEGLDLDFSPFGETPLMEPIEKNVSASSMQSLMKKVLQNTEEEEEESVLNSDLQSPKLVDFPDTVEYGPPKEQELFDPPTAQIDLSHFSEFVADSDPHYYPSLPKEDVYAELKAAIAEVPDLFDQLATDDAPGLFEDVFDEFDLGFAQEEDDELTEEMRNPFHDYQFDIEHFIKHNPGAVHNPDIVIPGSV